MSRIICLLIGFVFGSIPTGYIYGKAMGVNVRLHGSGNTGATNLMRTLGKKAGAITLVGDMLKVLIPMAIMYFVLKENEEMRYVNVLYTGLGADLGHCYSPFLGFNGGKGVACAAALLLFADPRFFFVALAAFVVLVATTGYVSVGSMTAAVLFFVLTIFFSADCAPFGWGKVLTYGPQYRTEILLVTFLIAFVVVYRHKANIKRLIAGNENKMFKKK